MPVSSEDLFLFVQTCSRPIKKLGENGEIIDYVHPPLEQEPLSKALEAVAALASNERSLAARERELELAYGKQQKLTAGGGAMAN